MITKDHTVVVLGASNKAERYSNKAIRQLKQHHYRVIPVHPLLHEIEGIPVAKRLDQIQEKVDTLTVYLEPQKSQSLIASIVALRPGRVILNPGTESVELENRLSQNKIPCIKACTLVLLQSGEF